MSTNISKQKRDDLILKIGQIRTFISAAPQDENTGNLLTYLSELEKDVRGKKYGLIFEEHREEIDEVLSTHAPVLTEEGSLFIDNGGQMNFLIEGDNLASLQLLEKTHKDRIDVIYIDPPYNTGSRDFRYDDVFVEKTDLFSHSKWLSFMENRLKIARRLLSSKGTIFISIDDNEQAPLKMLCDSIFGEELFVANISWQRTYSMRNDSKGIASEVEHILVYSKSTEWNPKKLERTAEMDSKYKNPDNDPRGAWRNIVASAPNASTHQGMVYAIQNPLTGEYCYPPQGRCWALGQDQMLSAMSQWCEYGLVDLNDDEARAKVCGVGVEQVRKNVLAIVIKCSLEEAKEKAQEKYNGVIPEFFFSQKGKGALSRKAYINTMGGRPVTNFWPHAETGHTDEASRLLKTIFDGTAVFDTPKPPRLIERILHIASNETSIILDFFAGSGTTGHAVLKYNAEHNESNRRFILCTNNENNICRDVTYERIKRVIDKESYAGSLKYYKVDYVPISERLYYEYADELLCHIRELVELENGINFTGNAEIAIVLTEEELAEFMENIDAYSKCRKLYMGHDILPDEEQEKSLAKHGIEKNIIPDYYYRELQEV